LPGGFDAGEVLVVDKKIGSGSYGTVHLLKSKLRPDRIFVGKRPWRSDELLEMEDAAALPKKKKNETLKKKENKDYAAKKREERCAYYWNVEKHCFEKCTPSPQLPTYLGTSKTSSAIVDGTEKQDIENEWMVFEFVGDVQRGSSGVEDAYVPAPSLDDLMWLDFKESSDGDDKHGLRHIADALGTKSYEGTLDAILPSLLTILSDVHEQKMVHRDVKPANLLVRDRELVLIDFGSAADLDPPSSSGSLGGRAASIFLGSQNGRDGTL